MRIESCSIVMGKTANGLLLLLASSGLLLGQEARVKTTSTDGTHVVEVVIEKLSRDEIREGVKRLRQLKVVREDLVQREKYIGELEGLAKQREALRQDAYKIGLDKLKVAEDQRDIEKMKREHYQDLYEELSKKRGGGFKCGLRAVFSLGMSRCG